MHGNVYSNSHVNMVWRGHWFSWVWRRWFAQRKKWHFHTLRYHVAICNCSCTIHGTSFFAQDHACTCALTCDYANNVNGITLHVSSVAMSTYTQYVAFWHAMLHFNKCTCSVHGTIFFTQWYVYTCTCDNVDGTTFHVAVWNVVSAPILCWIDCLVSMSHRYSV
jgi:hypothetical protein